MKIKETIERECCQRRDLRPVEGSPKIGRDPVWMFCVYCGRRHKYRSFIDPAGSRDWEYTPVEENLEAA